MRTPQALAALLAMSLLAFAQCQPLVKVKTVDLTVSTQSGVFSIKELAENQTALITRGAIVSPVAIRSAIYCNPSCAPEYSNQSATFYFYDSESNASFSASPVEGDFFKTPWGQTIFLTDVRVFAECKLVCDDGTYSDYCSIDKPKYCLNGVLVDRASACGCPRGFAQKFESCIQLSCSDETPFHSCSIDQPKYCNDLGKLVDNATHCGCPFNYTQDKDKCIPPKCADGTVYGECSPQKPYYCDPGKGALAENPSKCGCPPTWLYEGDRCRPTVCIDGTPLTDCSATQPLFCLNGSLVNKSSVCGCPEGFVPLNDSCDPKRCTDGTVYGECSLERPKFCLNGRMTDNAILCGCPYGFSPSGRLCVPSESVIISYAEKPGEENRIREVVILFLGTFIGLVILRRLCGSRKKPAASQPPCQG